MVVIWVFLVVFSCVIGGEIINAEFQYENMVDETCKRLYNQTNYNHNDVHSVSTVFNQTEIDWIFSHVADVLPSSDSRKKLNRKTNSKVDDLILLDNHPMIRHFVHYIVYERIIPHINERFELSDGLLGVKRMYFVVDDSHSTVAEKLSTLSNKERGDYNFIISLSSDYQGGEVQLFNLSTAAEDSALEDEVLADKQSTDTLESLDDTPGPTCTNTPELPATLSQNGINLTAGMFVAFSARQYHRLLPVSRGKRYLLVGHLTVGSHTACDVYNALNPRSKQQQKAANMRWIATGILLFVVLLIAGLCLVEMGDRTRKKAV